MASGRDNSGQRLSAASSAGSSARSTRKAGEQGFTLIELMVVMLIIGVLMLIAVPNYISAVNAAKESVLKEDLHVMRNAIDSYTMDKQKAPQSLQDLVDSGYLKSIPTDPMTRTNDAWVVDTSDSLHSVDQTNPGIDDVHSSSQANGADDKPYSTW